jgi:hypothetical protein
VKYAQRVGDTGTISKLLKLLQQFFLKKFLKEKGSGLR